MYITKINIKNIRCCEDLEINFSNPSRSILISGDNGDGKSIELIDNKKDSYAIITKIESLEAFERLTQEVYKGNEKLTQDNFPWHKIFVCGYGAGIRTSGNADFQQFFALEAVYPIFRYDISLQNPELIFRRVIEEAREKGGRDAKKGQKYADEMFKYLVNLLKELLNLESKDDIYLSSTGIKVKSDRWGISELGALGDGYKATTTWILDLISWWVLYLNRKTFYKHRNIRGIVLIDEVEQHLHPRWQLKIMNLLNNSFRRIQFIATTHSPLVISGSQKVPVYLLYRGKHSIRNVYGWLAEDVYREIMQLPTSREEQFREKINRYEKLHFKSLQKKLTPKERKNLNSLKRELQKLPGTDPTALIKELENLSKDFK